MVIIWAAAWQNQQNGVYARRTLRSTWADAQSDQSLLRALWVAKDPMLPHADSEDSNQTGRINAQADLSLCWTHRSFCWFCHAGAHTMISLFFYPNMPSGRFYFYKLDESISSLRGAWCTVFISIYLFIFFVQTDDPDQTLRFAESSDFFLLFGTGTGTDRIGNKSPQRATIAHLRNS